MRSNVFHSGWLVLSAFCVLIPLPTPANEPTLPENGFSADRYEVLWAKSPFAVSSADITAGESPDYDLVGVAEFDGVPYASLIDKKTQMHFLVYGNKAEQGLTLVSISRGQTIAETAAIFSRNGDKIVLKLKTSASAGANNAAVPAIQQRLTEVISPHPPTTFAPAPIFSPPMGIHIRPIRLPPRPFPNASAVPMNQQSSSGAQSYPP